MTGTIFKLNWISLTLLLSLGINFFIGGYLYSQYKSKQIRMTRLAFDNSISRIVEPFPRKAKHDFYITMRSKRDQLIPMYRNIMSQRMTIMTIVAREQLESDKLRNALQEYHNSYHSMVEESQEVIIKIIEKLDLNERKEIFTRYQNPPKRSSRRGRENRRPTTGQERMPSTNHDW